ncbi:MAG: FMN-binding negative transcriptional regulator [Pseudomonadota bacterium]|nr:FMN-binding negative transcriptional regulator [Pseudomonadota bacterium]
MHPATSFRNPDRALLETMVEEIGFGMVFAQTPDGPRVAHVPLLWTKNGAVQFHLARGNALTKHLNGMTVLAVINGPDGYVSPRWYADPEQVPTWNYVALELEGRVRRMDAEELLGQITALSDKHEARIAAGKPWSMDKLPEAKSRAMQSAIVGFELEVIAWRETMKLSQNKSPDERERVAAGLEGEGAGGIAALMRSLAP